MGGDLICIGLDFAEGVVRSDNCNTMEGKLMDGARGVALPVIGGAIGAASGLVLLRNPASAAGGFAIGGIMGQVVSMVWGDDLPQPEPSPESQLDSEICKLKRDRLHRLQPLISNLAAATQEECGFSPIYEDRLKDRTEQ